VEGLAGGRGLDMDGLGSGDEDLAVEDMRLRRSKALGRVRAGRGLGIWRGGKDGAGAQGEDLE